ncbi:MAG: hypothetical protein ACOYK8_05605 [Alphaproteobacteria bacterium]
MKKRHLKISSGRLVFTSVSSLVLSAVVTACNSPQPPADNNNPVPSATPSVSPSFAPSPTIETPKATENPTGRELPKDNIPPVDKEANKDKKAAAAPVVVPPKTVKDLAYLFTQTANGGVNVFCGLDVQALSFSKNGFFTIKCAKMPQGYRMPKDKVKMATQSMNMVQSPNSSCSLIKVFPDTEGSKTFVKPDTKASGTELWIKNKAFEFNCREKKGLDSDKNKKPDFRARGNNI